MSSMTAQIAVGMPDRYHDGIRPTHLLWLRENDIPSWTLIEVNEAIYESGQPQEKAPWATEPIRWVGSWPDQILKDGILLIVAHVLRHEEVLEGVEDEARELLASDRVELWKLDPATLDTLHRDCQDFDLPGKLVVTVLGGSSLEQQLPLLADYSIQVEVCTVTYSHTWGGFGGSERSKAAPAGSLTASWSTEGPTADRYRDVNFPASLPGHLAEEDEDPQ
jgi:hypothetical protein